MFVVISIIKHWIKWQTYRNILQHSFHFDLFIVRVNNNMNSELDINSDPVQTIKS